MGSIRRDKLPVALTFVVGGIVLLVLSVIGGDPFNWVFLALFVALGLWSWPGRRGRHTDHAEAQAAAKDDDVVVYWRPG